MTRRYIYDKADTGRGIQSFTYRNDAGTEVVAYSGALYNNKGPDLELDAYLALPTNADRELEVIDEATMEARTNDYHASLVTPAREIDAETFEEALNVLPPENWQRLDGWNHFRMCEYYTGPITTQYAQCGDRYLTKQIDVTRPDTWISRGDFAQ